MNCVFVRVRACVRACAVVSPSESEIGRKHKYARRVQRWRAIVGR